jgi:hypothetical protein
MFLFQGYSKVVNEQGPFVLLEGWLQGMPSTVVLLIFVVGLFLLVLLVLLVRASRRAARRLRAESKILNHRKEPTTVPQPASAPARAACQVELEPSAEPRIERVDQPRSDEVTPTSQHTEEIPATKSSPEPDAITAPDLLETQPEKSSPEPHLPEVPGAGAELGSSSSGAGLLSEKPVPAPESVSISSVHIDQPPTIDSRFEPISLSTHEEPLASTKEPGELSSEYGSAAEAAEEVNPEPPFLRLKESEPLPPTEQTSDKRLGTSEECEESDAAEVLSEPAQPKSRPLSVPPTTREPRAPHKYKPTPRDERPKRIEETARPRPDTIVPRACPVCVRIVFERGGYCRITLVPSRLPDSPSRIPTSGTGGHFELSALTDEWYEDVTTPNLGDLLREGVEWQATPEGTVLRWSLSGREVYVLGPSDQLSGYLSTNRLLIGEDHVVLCTHRMRPEVERLLNECASGPFQVITKANGLPAGWVGFRGVAPTRPVAPSVEGSVLDCLCPSPDVEISLSGGIRLGRSTWLIGYPPHIRLRGDTEHVRALYIDESQATLDADGNLIAPGWDQEGDHIIACEGMSRSYEIANPPEGWSAWSAYSFSLGAAPFAPTSAQPEICGALVRPFDSATSTTFLALVPGTHPIVLGAGPGQVFSVPMPPGPRRFLSVAFAPFEPVWAVPAEPFHVDRAAVRILLVGSPISPRRLITRKLTFRDTVMIRRWCDAILNCGRKRLAVEPDEHSIRLLWRSYKGVAKQLGRLLR